MIVKRFYDENARPGELPDRVRPYRRGDRDRPHPRHRPVPPEAAGRGGCAITHVTETHIHADFVSGSARARRAHRRGALPVGRGWRRLAVRASPRMRARCCSATATASWSATCALDVLHTPGHTPEHLAFLVTDTAVGRPSRWRMVTGDFVFVGDVGRPDLLETRREACTGTMEAERPHALPVARSASSALARLSAALARPRRRVRVRQGAQRGAAEHARLRAALQLGVWRSTDEDEFVRAGAGGTARAADVLRAR